MITAVSSPKGKLWQTSRVTVDRSIVKTSLFAASELLVLVRPHRNVADTSSVFRGGSSADRLCAGTTVGVRRAVAAV